MRHVTVAALLLSFSLSLAAPAAARAGGDEGRRHHRPPPAAFEACKGKAEGDACSFEGHRGTVNGTCQPTHKSETLVCTRPHHDR
jgi:hypothetical protein